MSSSRRIHLCLLNQLWQGARSDLQVLQCYHYDPAMHGWKIRLIYLTQNERKELTSSIQPAGPITAGSCSYVDPLQQANEAQG